MIKGLLVEDDQGNIDSYKQRFLLRDIELIDIDTFPPQASDFWNIVLEKDVDFIIIDNHLHKKSVPYNGWDVLKEIRDHDSEIYIIYLTSKGISIDEPLLSHFDLEVDKLNLDQEFQTIAQRIHRAYSRDVSLKMEREIDKARELQQKYFEERMKILKNKLG